jgi:hypothetical protein
MGRLLEHVRGGTIPVESTEIASHACRATVQALLTSVNQRSRFDQATAGAEIRSVCRNVWFLVQFAGHILGVQNCLCCRRILFVHQDVE